MFQVLSPTDFSKNSWNAITYGLDLLKKSRCTFHFLHINPVPPYSAVGSSIRVSSSIIEETLIKDSNDNLQFLLKRIRQGYINPNHSFATIALYDFFVDTIKREVENKNIDLIIMGTKGASGLKKATIGSNTGDVITKVKCPLLAVPENAGYKVPKEIAFPTDYHLGYDIRVLDTLIQMANTHGSVLRVLHISKKGEELSTEQLRNKDFLNDYLKDMPHTFHSVTGTKLDTAVQCFTESREIDMVAMVAKNLNFFQRILFRPTVEEISYHTEIPFLVLHE